MVPAPQGLWVVSAEGGKKKITEKKQKPFPALACRQIYLEYIGLTEILAKC